MTWLQKGLAIKHENHSSINKVPTEALIKAPHRLLSNIQIPSQVKIFKEFTVIVTHQGSNHNPKILIHNVFPRSYPK